MAKEHRSPRAWEGQGTQVEAQWKSSRGPSRWAPAGALGLIVLFLHAACAMQAPMSNQVASGVRPRSSDPSMEPGLESAVFYEVSILEPGKVSTQPVPINKAEFQRSVERLAKGLRFTGTPKEAARALLKLAQGGELREVERVAMTGDWEGKPTAVRSTRWCR